MPATTGHMPNSPEPRGGHLLGSANLHDEQPRTFLAIQAELDLENFNHRRRPTLGNRTACELLAAGRNLARADTRPRRKEVYDWIQ